MRTACFLASAALVAATLTSSAPAVAAGCGGYVNVWVPGCAPWDNNPRRMPGAPGYQAPRPTAPVAQPRIVQQPPATRPVLQPGVNTRAASSRIAAAASSRTGAAASSARSGNPAKPSLRRLASLCRRHVRRRVRSRLGRAMGSGMATVGSRRRVGCPLRAAVLEPAARQGHSPLTSATMRPGVIGRTPHEVVRGVEDGLMDGNAAQRPAFSLCDEEEVMLGVADDDRDVRKSRGAGCAGRTQIEGPVEDLVGQGRPVFPQQGFDPSGGLGAVDLAREADAQAVRQACPPVGDREWEGGSQSPQPSARRPSGWVAGPTFRRRPCARSPEDAP